MFMKYIISESRLERLVITYLSSLDFREGYRDTEGVDIMYNGDRAINYRSRGKNLYVSTDLINDIKSLFNLSQREVLNYVKMWFQDEYNVEVKSLWLLFPDEPFTY
jgi:hypothetical protein